MTNPGYGIEEKQTKISSANVPYPAQSYTIRAAATANEMNNHENVKQVNRSNEHASPNSIMSKQASVPSDTVPDDDDSATKTHMSHQVQSTAMNQTSRESSASHSTVISHEQDLAGCSVVSEQVSHDQTLEERSFDQPKYVEDLSSDSISTESGSNGPASFNPVCDQTLAIGDRAGAVPKLLLGIPPVHNQTINWVVHNYYSSPENNLVPGHEWNVSYEKCQRIARDLDLPSIRENWKVLASKLKFDRIIDGVEQIASNKGGSPTVILLREWMKSQDKENRDTCYQRLIKALQDMGRIDIVDDLEEIDH